MLSGLRAFICITLLSILLYESTTVAPASGVMSGGEPARPSSGTVMSPDSGGVDSYVISLDKSDCVKFGDFFSVMRHGNIIGSAQIVSADSDRIVISIISCSEPVKKGDRVVFVRHRNCSAQEFSGWRGFLGIFRESQMHSGMVVCEHCGLSISRSAVEKFSDIFFQARCGKSYHEIIQIEQPSIAAESFSAATKQSSPPLHSSFCQPYVLEMTTNTSFVSIDDFMTVDDFPSMNDIQCFNSSFNRWNRSSAFTSDIMKSTDPARTAESHAVNPELPLYLTVKEFLSALPASLSSFGQVRDLPDVDGYDRNNNPIRLRMRNISTTQVTKSPVLSSGRTGKNSYSQELLYRYDTRTINSIMLDVLSNP